jgi:cellulose synthase/poly-beta-1,6-N-acetylglucosamine synthase-like glycosyltransferase
MDLQTETILKQISMSVTVGICATTELENTKLITDAILSLNNAQVNLLKVIVATPNGQLANHLAGRDPRLVVEFERKREGKASALNRILRRASGDILVIASADIRLERNTIPRLVRALVEHSDWGAVDSRVELVNGDRLLMDRVSNLLWGIHNSTLDELDENGRLGHAGDLFAVRRDLIDTMPDVINDDAYLALKVNQKGFRVKRVRDAVVWIVGPRTPADYLYQRSRVLRGHLQLIGLFGKMPTTFEFQVLGKPRQTLGLLVKAVAALGPSHLLPMVVAGVLEFLSFQLALVASITERGHKPWRIAQTTKRI